MFKFPDRTGGIIMIVHHLISDAFSCNLVANKTASLYNAPLPISLSTSNVNSEKLIHSVFTSALKLDKISVLQNIFDLSVESLTIIKIQAKLYFF